MKTWKNKKTQKLFEAILKLKNRKECEKFFRDLLTLDEIEEFSKRWEACRMINKKIPYREVAKKTGLSTATVTRVAHWLKFGEGGYRLILERLSGKS